MILCEPYLCDNIIDYRNIPMNEDGPDMDMVEDGKNGWIVPFNMRNIEPEKWLKKPKFTYTPPYSKWNEELKGESTYDPSTAPLSYKCIKRYDDTIIGKRIEIGEAVECDEARAEYLKNKGVLE